MMNTRQAPEHVREHLARMITARLRPQIELCAIARRMNGAGPGLTPQPALQEKAITPLAAYNLRRMLYTLRRYAADLLLPTGDEADRIRMRGWRLRRNGSGEEPDPGGLYVHIFEKDEPEELHGQPWPSASLLLSGGPIVNHAESGAVEIGNGDMFVRTAREKYRITLRPAMRESAGPYDREPAVLLVATGERVREPNPGA